MHVRHHNLYDVITNSVMLSTESLCCTALSCRAVKLLLYVHVIDLICTSYTVPYCPALSLCALRNLFHVIVLVLFLTCDPVVSLILPSHMYNMRTYVLF